MYKYVFKRLLDILLSGLALFVLSPVFFAVSILIRIKLGTPVIFEQKRPGKNGKIFKMYKFRTMLEAQTCDGKKLTDNERLACIKEGIPILSDEERLTKFGRILRAFSLDELPELWNIFIGDMSIVGPRPLASIYLPYYTKEEMRRHEIRPGLTGLAQVHGRNSASWEKRFKYDVYYVDHVSVRMDIRIILETVAVVLKREGIGQGEERPESFNIVRQKQWDKAEVIENVDDNKNRKRR